MQLIIETKKLTNKMLDPNFIVLASFLFLSFVSAASSLAKENDNMNYNQESPVSESALLIEQLRNEIVSVKKTRRRAKNSY